MILDDAVPQRTHKINVGRGPSHHAQRLVPHRKDGIAAGVHRADAGLAEHHPLLFGGDNDGGSPQIKADIVLFH